MAQQKVASPHPLYRDIARRTQGDIYIGVVGPVRTGKSSLIAGLIDKLVLPLMEESPRKQRLRDEMPQPASGRQVMTTQPHFYPGEGAAEIRLEEGMDARVRLVDSVGYLIPGAQEGEEARMVSTPWADRDLPFEEAAALGTRKVMEDHAQMGLVVTCDGTVSDLPRSAYVQAEERAVHQLQALGKPFALVLNSAQPDSREAVSLRESLENKYDVPVTLMNVKEMEAEDISKLLSSVLMQFPLRQIRFTLPEWVGALEEDHWLPRHILESVRALGGEIRTMRDKKNVAAAFSASPHLMPPQDEEAAPGDAALSYTLPLKDGLFNQILSEQCGEEIHGDAHLLSLMKEMTRAKREYDRVAGALSEVARTGYGLVPPAMEDIALQQPELMRQGSRWGVRLKASAPALHLIQSEIETEIAPVLGAQEQSEQFVRQLQQQYDQDPAGLWDTNFFGRSLQSLIQEGLSGKMLRMPPDAREKVQSALSRMLNEGEGGMICILL